MHFGSVFSFLPVPDMMESGFGGTSPGMMMMMGGGGGPLGMPMGQMGPMDPAMGQRFGMGPMFEGSMQGGPGPMGSRMGAPPGMGDMPMAPRKPILHFTGFTLFPPSVRKYILYVNHISLCTSVNATNEGIYNVAHQV